MTSLGSTLSCCCYPPKTLRTGPLFWALVDSDASPGAPAMQGYTCVTATPCLGDGGGCTQRCVPLAATFCADICPNALDAVPLSGAAAGGNGMPSFY